MRITNINVSRRHDCSRLVFHHDCNVVNQQLKKIEERILLVYLNLFQRQTLIVKLLKKKQKWNNPQNFVNNFNPGRTWPHMTKVVTKVL